MPRKKAVVSPVAVVETQEVQQEENPFNFLVKSVLAIEGVRIAVQIRQSHLALRNRKDPETDELLRRLQEVEDYADGRMATLLTSHPAYPWFSRVKGVGQENIGKVIGLMDITKADTLSSLWSFAGFGVVNGKAPKREKGGGKLAYNSRLRTMCWRLGTSLLKGGGCFYEYYAREKEKYLVRYRAEGKKIIPAAQLPTRDGKRYEPEGVISEGHVHNQALRKMIKLFLASLWIVWREAEGLDTRNPYVIEKLGHAGFISPWEMVDREEKKAKKKK